MKLSDKVALAAVCMLVIAAAAFAVGVFTQSVHWCASSVAFLLFAVAFYSEALVYMGEGR